MTRLLLSIAALLALPPLALALIIFYPPSEAPIAIVSAPIDSARFIGKPANPRPLAVDLYEHPELAPGGISTIHSGAHNSDVHLPAGPLGRKPRLTTRKGPTLIGGMCSTTVFGQQDVLITFCGSLAGFEFQMLEPRTLKLLARYRLPQRPSTLEGLLKFNFDLIMSDTSGGAYFYLDRDGYVVFADSRQQVQRLGHRQREDGRWEFYLAQSWDLNTYVPLECFSLARWFPDPQRCDPITAVTPDHQGLIWWVTRKGRIGTLDPESSRVRLLRLEGEEIQNSFAVAEDGVYIVSDHAMYALRADAQGTPVILWREEYDRGSYRKTGLATQGAGTTPTLIGDDYITVTDNADGRVNLLVWKRRPEFNGERLVCKVPLFEPGRSATEISMIAYDRSIIIENTYGYWNALQQTEWEPVVGGISRIDIRDDDSGCEPVWSSPERSPSGVGKLSAGNGLVYFYTFMPQGTGENAWYLTALDARKGRTVFKILTGAGANYDVNWGPLTIGPDGTLYASAKGGFIALWDGE